MFFLLDFLRLYLKLYPDPIFLALQCTNYSKCINSSFSGQDDQSEVVLRVSHLQGAFYLLGFGYGAAALGLLGEHLAFSRLTTRVLYALKW